MKYKSMKPKIIFQGAEAKIISSNNLIIKSRVKKSYRIKELDERIRELRTRSEAKLIERASKIIPVPKIIKVDDKEKEISMEYIEGKRISDTLESFPVKEQLKIFKNIGENIAKLHNSEIIHGDLTTSNIILKNKQIYFIDFGLGFFSRKIEDKAVDLHLLKHSLESKHFQNSSELFKQVLKGYASSKESKKVFERFKKVEKRGRYKDQY
jgi:TP53 regulating kinase and related kinases